MDVPGKVEHIRKGLEARGESGSYSQVARLLDVSPSTVSRWVKGVMPTNRQFERLNLLYRTVCEAEEGNEDAKKILGALLGVAGASLLGLGVGGILIAAGLGWLIGERNETS